jgi:hypothetical protein
MRFRVDHKLFLSKGLLPAKISEIRGPRSRPVLDKICACRTRETASTSGARCGSAAQASILRYYAQDRRQRTEFLCKRDEKHDSKTCKPVRDIASKVMARVNSGALAAAESPTVAEFWDGTYLPFAEKNLRPSTVHSYGDLGERHLQPSLRRREARDLQELRRDGVPHRPVREARQELGQPRAFSDVGNIQPRVRARQGGAQPDARGQGARQAEGDRPTQHYTLGEAEDIVSALAGDSEAQSVMALSCFMGLRPSEIARAQVGGRHQLDGPHQAGVRARRRRPD